MNSLIFIKLVCLIAEVMDPIRFVILLYMSTLCNCVFFILIKLVCLIAEVTDLIWYVILLSIGS